VKDRISDKKIRIIYIASMIVLFAITAVTFSYCANGRIYNLRSAYISDVSVDFVGLIICAILIFSLSHDKPWDAHNRTFFRILFVLCLLFHFDCTSSFLEGNPKMAYNILIVNSLNEFFITLLVYCFWAYIREELKLDKGKINIANYVCKITILLDAVLNTLNIKYGFFFTVNSSGEYVDGPFASTKEITVFIIYLTICYMIVKTKERSVKEKSILLTFLIFPMISHGISAAFSSYSLIAPSFLFSVMMIYINVFASRSKRILEQQALLSEQSKALMISQIQPHFIYNVLTTISNLCVTDPEEAEETTVLFSQYLRTNLDSLRKSDPVPFQQELGHIKTYVELEKKRFGDKLNVEYDIQEAAFLVPSLGLQPIVENSIKHGIRGKDTPGHLKISSRKVPDGYEVIIEDDGIGFDMSAPAPEDGRSHVGMINVKSRLEQMCNAQVTTISSPGNGCKTTITFPGA